MTCPHRRARARASTVALASAVAASLSWSSPVAAAPQWVRLSFTGSTDTSMTVSWNTPTNVGGEVLFGTSPGNLGQTVAGTTVQGPGQLGFVHEATLTNLTPGTTYFYKAGDAADGYSAEATFVTGPQIHPECGSFKFLFMGDNRPDPTLGGGENYDQILNQAAAHAPSFILAGGDLVIDGDDLDQWSTFLGYTESSSSQTPFMPCIGNHDTGPGEGDGANYNRIFALPKSTGQYGSNTEDYYYFTFGNVIVAALSTESFAGGNTPFATQAAWLDEVLTAHPQMWKIVILHKPIYTDEVFFSISHAPNEENQNAALVPVFDAHHVDVVVASHNHWYERYEPSACANQNDPGSDQPCTVGNDPAFGTVYLVSGGAGAFTIPEWLSPSADGRAKISDDHHYVLFDVSDTQLTLEAWAAYPEPNQIMDSLVIQKTGSVDCEALGGGGAGGSSSGTGGAGGASGTGGDGAGSGTGGGATGTGGSATGTGGGGANGAGSGANGTGAAAAAGSPGEDGGCGCELPRSPDHDPRWLGFCAAALALAIARRRRRGR